MPVRATKQLVIPLPEPRTWGGRRKGAGRKRGPNSGVSHQRRPPLSRHHPAHVTLKLRRALGSLRTKKKAAVVRRAVVAAITNGVRIIDWSIQHDHIHLIVEAGDRVRLSRCVQGLSIRIARGLNRVLGRRGKVFADRYHVRVLTNPRQVRNAKAYVLLNRRRHAARGGKVLPGDWMDPFSSWAWSEGWRDLSAACLGEARAGPERERCAAAPETWLLRVGWRRHGLIGVGEVPGRGRPHVHSGSHVHGSRHAAGGESASGNVPATPVIESQKLDTSHSQTGTTGGTTR